MKEIILSKKISLPIDALSLRWVEFGNSGAGKTALGRVIFEEADNAGVPTGVIDLKGDWWGLKSSKSGESTGREVIIFGGDHADVLQSASKNIQEEIAALSNCNKVIDGELKFFKDAITKRVTRDKIFRPDFTNKDRTSIDYKKGPVKLNYDRARVLRPASSNGSLPEGETKILSACIQFDSGVTKQQLTVLTGFKRSTRDAYIARLRAKRYVQEMGDKVAATTEGCAALPDAQPLPTGVDLQKYWLQRLPEGERKIFEILLNNYPSPIDKETITEITGFKRSTRDAYLSRMSSKMITAEPQRGMVMADQQLFA